MRARLTSAWDGGLLRSLSVLVGGTALAHLITALVLPVSTRLYTPEDFSAASAFMSVVNILAVVACLRYEMAIPLVDDDDDAANLLALSCLLAVAAGGLVGLVAWLWPSVFALLRQPRLMPYLWLFPIALAASGSYLALQMWFVRRKTFPVIAGSRVLQSVVAGAAQVGLGAAGVTPLGLLLGQAANTGAGSVVLAGRMALDEKRALSGVNPRRMAALSVHHVRFPKFSVWEALANAASIYAPVLLIAALAPGPAAGYLALATFVLQAPMALVGNSIQQIYVGAAPEEDRNGRLGRYTAGMLRTLSRISAGPLILIAIAAPSGFALVFGAEWRQAGVLAAWMTPWFLAQFLASPISAALHVRGRQRTAMVLQVVGFGLRVGGVLAAAQVASGLIAEVYAISGFVFYFLYLLVIAKAADLEVSDFRSAAKAALVPAIAGVVGGSLLAILIPMATDFLAR